jgi:peptide/nickel transport system substrate-binding protein
MVRGLGRRSISTLVLVVALAAACTQQAASPSAQPSQTGASSTTPPTTPPAPKTVTIGVGTKWTSFNPLKETNGYSVGAINLMYDTLAWQSPDGKFNPRLAASWTNSADYKTYTFKLDPRAKWSDGTPVTAKDVVATIAMGADKTVASVAASQTKLLVGTDDSGYSTTPGQAPSGVRAVDDTTVELTLKAPADPNLVLFGIGANTYGFNIMPASVLSGIQPADLAKASFGTEPKVTSGPFLFVSGTIGESIEFKKNPNYFLGVPKIDRLFYKYVPQASMLASLQSGDIDVTSAPGVNSDLQLQDWQSLASNTNVKGASVPGTAQDSPIINTAKPYLKDARVRQALTMAVDRNLLVKQVLGGQGAVAVSQINPLSPFYDRSIQPYPYDAAKAKSLLQDAKFPFDTELNLVTLAGRATIAQSAQIMQQQFAAIGVKSKITSLEIGAFVTATQNGDFDLSFLPTTFSSAQGIADPGTTALFFTCKGSANYSKLCDDVIDKAYADGAATPVIDQRTAAYKTLQTQVHDQAPILFTYIRNGIPAYRARVNQALQPTALGLVTPWLWDVSQ